MSDNVQRALAKFEIFTGLKLPLDELYSLIEERDSKRHKRKRRIPPKTKPALDPNLLPYGTPSPR